MKRELEHDCCWWHGGFDSTYEGLKPAGGESEKPSDARFDSTYEGLKQPTAYHPDTHPTCFDSTYEGLKHLPGGLPGGDEDRFDSTYEGLKLPAALLSRRTHRVSTVPMRA